MGKVAAADTAAPSEGARRKKSRPGRPARPEIYVAPSHQWSSWLFSLTMLVLVLPALLTYVAIYLGTDAANPPSFFIRLVLCIFLDSVYGGAYYAILLPPARVLARFLPGAWVPESSKECEKQENAVVDLSIQWPLPASPIPTSWIDVARRSKRDNPFFLNHVRGSTRLRQAVFRLTAALGTVTMVHVMNRFVDHGSTLADIGLEISFTDIGWGFVVGSAIVIILFLVEVALGWIQSVGYCEVVVPGESLILNLLWDILFHIGVSANEEISLRGWILVNTALYVRTLGQSPSEAMAVAVALQAGVFALMHVGSPGASRVGLINLVIGGTVAALNVFLSGGLSFSLGWHFGWNIWMGHFLGLSTSGIPMSAKLISVVPDPKKASLHGGKFGPEQSPLAATAYLLGCTALVLIYGGDGLAMWRDKLA